MFGKVGSGRSVVKSMNNICPMNNDIPDHLLIRNIVDDVLKLSVEIL